MKVRSQILVALLLLSSVTKVRANDTPTPTCPLKDRFRRTLIVGASISAGWSSPGKVLARWMKSETLSDWSSIGATSNGSLSGMTDETLENKKITAIVGIDLFFWDVQRRSDGILERMDTLVARAKKANALLILGNIPDHYRPNPELKEKINQHMSELAAKNPHLIIADLNALYTTLKTNDMIVDGQKLTLSQVFPDGLHTSSQANTYVAKLLISKLILDPKEQDACLNLSRTPASTHKAMKKKKKEKKHPN